MAELEAPKMRYEQQICTECGKEILLGLTNLCDQCGELVHFGCMHDHERYNHTEPNDQEQAILDDLNDEW